MEAGAVPALVGLLACGDSVAEAAATALLGLTSGAAEEEDDDDEEDAGEAPDGQHCAVPAAVLACWQLVDLPDGVQVRFPSSGYTHAALCCAAGGRAQGRATPACLLKSPSLCVRDFLLAQACLDLLRYGDPLVQDSLAGLLQVRGRGDWRRGTGARGGRGWRRRQRRADVGLAVFPPRWRAQNVTRSVDVARAKVLVACGCVPALLEAARCGSLVTQEGAISALGNIAAETAHMDALVSAGEPQPYPLHRQKQATAQLATTDDD